MTNPMKDYVGLVECNEDSFCVDLADVMLPSIHLLFQITDSSFQSQIVVDGSLV